MRQIDRSEIVPCFDEQRPANISPVPASANRAVAVLTYAKSASFIIQCPVDLSTFRQPNIKITIA